MGFNKKIGFDSQKYLREQTKYILQRVKGVKGKLYLEFGGKILCDYHAARVLPGFDPNAKIKLLQKVSQNCFIFKILFFVPFFFLFFSYLN